MSRAEPTALEAGREAAARNAWNEAFERFREAEATGTLDPADLESMADAAWWTGRLDESIAARERAFAGRIGEASRRRAALIATELAKNYYVKGSPSIGSGWLKRAERLLADEPEGVEHGWLHRIRSALALEGAHDYETALAEAREAREVAARFHDAELLAVALHDEGRTLVMRGDVEEGMALIEEATAPAVAGELSPMNTAIVYCNTITACKDLADYRRAGDWSDAAKRWCDRQAIAGFPGMCRVYRASVMAVRGAWPEAELEARRACEELPAFNRGYAAEAFYELGEIRLRAGDLAAADDAFAQAHELGRDPQPGLALLRLAEGKPDGATSCIVQALDAESSDLHRARLLPARVEIALAADELEAAEAAADELHSIAARYRSEALRASAHDARAASALARGDARTAIREARAALRLWQAIDAPYDAARVRVRLGRAYLAADDDEDAALELRAAASAFERLGAVRDARAVREALGALMGEHAVPGVDRAARTFVFTDIVRSTDLVQAIGDEAWTDVVAWHDRTLRSLFSAHGGEEVDHAGDGFFVAFNDAESALACATAIQRRLADHRREHGFAPQVRIGVHATEAARQGTGYKGRGVHEAARIAALAQGGEIVASRTTVDAVDSPPAITEPRSVELKGIEAPVEVVSVEWQREGFASPASG